MINGKMKKSNYPKVGDILEITISWNETTKWIDFKSFMGQKFQNGESKRFKLLEKYKVKNGDCNCQHCVLFRKIEKSQNGGTYYGGTYSDKKLCYPIYSENGENNLTFHMFLNEIESGSFTDSFNTTIKWETVKDDGTPYCDEMEIVNPVRMMHT